MPKFIIEREIEGAGNLSKDELQNSGNVYVAGFSEDNNITRSCITKHNPANLQIDWYWSETYSKNSNAPILMDFIEDLAIDANNDLFAAGYRNAVLTPNGNHELFGPYSGSNALFRKFSGANGADLFRKEFEVTDKDAFYAINIDSSGDLFFGGTTVAFKQD